MFNGKIIWPVDVLDDQSLQGNALFLLGELTRATGASVQPVSILHPSHARFERERKNSRDAFRALADKRLAEIKSSSDMAKMREGKVLESRGDSVTEDVQALLDYAKAEEAGAIVVSTHARKLVPRLFLGSFAETLMLNSALPLFTVNPQTKVRERMTNILFPTTLDPEFEPAFLETLQLAKATDAKVTVYYKEPLIPAPFMSPEIYDYLELEAKQRIKDAQRWKEFGARAGVPVEAHLDNRPGYVSPAISQFAQEANFDLIVMCTRATQWSSILIGSTTRQVIREAPCPVWVIPGSES